MKKNLNLKSFVTIFAASTLFACIQDSVDLKIIPNISKQ